MSEVCVVVQLSAQTYKSIGHIDINENVALLFVQ